jgi:hypothetical protein
LSHLQQLARGRVRLQQRGTCGGSGGFGGEDLDRASAEAAGLLRVDAPALLQKGDSAGEFVDSGM